MCDNTNGRAVESRGNVKSEGITLFHNSAITLISDFLLPPFFVQNLHGGSSLVLDFSHGQN